MGKGEIARDKQFLPFPTVFSNHLKNFIPFSSNLKLSSANLFSLKEYKLFVWESVKNIVIHGKVAPSQGLDL